MRLIDADYLKTWFGERDLYTYDYIIGTINDAPTIEPEAKLLAEVKLSKEELQEVINKTPEKIRKEMEHPERKKGKWGEHGECPFCDYLRQWGDDKFCANCGADMRGEQDETE